MSLAGGRGRKHLGFGVAKGKAENPFSLRALLSRPKFPPLGGLQGQTIKVWAFARCIKFGFGYVSGCIHMDPNPDLNFPLDRVPGFLGHIWQDLLNDASSV